MSQSDTPTLTDSDLQTARDAGASPEFVTVVSTLPDVCGVGRNSARDEFRRAVSFGDDPEKKVRPTGTTGGHFYEALWNGNLAEAFFRADGTNTAILLHLFDPAYLTERMVAADEKSPEAAARYVNERVRRYE